MTTPVDIVMPYGVTMEGDGVNRTATPVTKSRYLRQNDLILLSGPCRVAVSWSGPESVRLTLAGVGYPVTIPAGGGWRSAMATIGAKGGDRIYLENVTGRPLTKGARGTIEVYPLVSIK